MKKWYYSLATPCFWSSFDFGEVVADTEEEALVLAKIKVKEDFYRANEALKSIGFTVEYHENSIEVEEIK